MTSTPTPTPDETPDTVLRYTAFSDVPTGGNPAGVVLDATGWDDARMLATAADLGYSETAFLHPEAADGTREIRYWSPLAEVPFCGHATIATAVAHAERHGPGTLRLATRAGAVEVVTRVVDGRASATLTSVPPQVRDLSDDEAAPLLAALGWSPDDLDPALPLRVAYAGAWHPVVAARTRQRLADLDYDFDALGALMADRGWTTVALVHRESPTVLHARNPFPPGGVVEDPATGAAAAAVGGYLRALGLVDPPADVVVHQGHDLGRPSLLGVHVPVGTGGIQVTGSGRSLKTGST